MQMRSFLLLLTLMPYSAVNAACAEQLLFELFTIFVAEKIGEELFERIRLPAVLGEILAGVVLGPFALGWVNPGWFHPSQNWEPFSGSSMPESKPARVISFWLDARPRLSP